MILMRAFNYLILDQCIEVFFNQIISNFNVEKSTILPKPGDFFSKIIAKNNSEIFYDCKITEVYLNEDETDYYIEFEYDEWDFIDAFDDDDILADNFLDDELPEDDDDSDIYDQRDDEVGFSDEDYVDSNNDLVAYSEYIFVK